MGAVGAEGDAGSFLASYTRIALSSRQSKNGSQLRFFLDFFFLQQQQQQQRFFLKREAASGLRSRYVEIAFRAVLLFCFVLHQ